jgi:tRNA G18 (ribose-2'-O)-methylase SpoU
MNTDSRNIIDHYKYWHNDAIMADLDTKRHNFSVLCYNVGNDFNIGSVIRNANAFLAREVVLYPQKRYDRRGTVGTHLYTHFQHFKIIEDLEVYIKDSVIIAFDDNPAAISLTTFTWPKKEHVTMVFGQESTGIPEELLDLAHNIVYIPQMGSVRSLNVGCASAIAMYDYINKMT